jgi:hypothetical protein
MTLGPAALARLNGWEEIMKIDGECHCGKIAYQAEVDPDMLVLCHCTDCQMLAGSPYRAVIPAAAETFKPLRGEPKFYSKTAESSNQIAQGFCGDCGTPSMRARPTIHRCMDSGLSDQAASAVTP